MKKRKFKISDILFGLFILLLLVPQTRKPIQVALNSLKVIVWTPSALAEEYQTQIAPFDYQLATVDGAETSISIGKGKVTFISYWATWCPPCIAELPSIQKLYNDYGNQVDFVLITDESVEKVKAFLAKKQYELPVFISRMPAPTMLSEPSIPTNYLVDQNGKIVIKEKGASDWNSKKVREVLDGLLK
ncbi:hypothetical protein MTsPCn5_30770 [Croceitalea sp. MTPC5]|uniref:TlpA family protein disulfide reductase n=1 Tax=Croceitalea sp. MTPC5 TaxID=3056565 RepID=UPI002B3E7607|nr:hypothetical protein MTsPCn5_30770 [Croceitalea sp. MTPC5]